MSRTSTRVLLDANVLISYLLSGDRPTTAVRLVEIVLKLPFTTLVSQELLDELTRKVTTKPHLANRIAPSELHRLVDTLRLLSEWIDLGDAEHPRVVRDRNDDYLIALGTMGHADVLITGDFDLLELDLPLPFRIMSMAGFLGEFAHE